MVIVFVAGYEVFERMAYYGIATNLVLYLTNKLHEGTVQSSTNVTNWVGTVWMTPILGAYIADAHLGRYRTFVISSAIYLMVYPQFSFTILIEYFPPISLPGFRFVICICDLYESSAEQLKRIVFSSDDLPCSINRS